MPWITKGAEENAMDEIIAKLDEYIRERCEVDDDPEYGLDVNQIGRAHV